MFKTFLQIGHSCSPALAFFVFFVYLRFFFYGIAFGGDCIYYISVFANAKFLQSENFESNIRPIHHVANVSMRLKEKLTVLYYLINLLNEIY